MYGRWGYRNVSAGKSAHRYSSEVEQTFGVWFFQNLFPAFDSLCSYKIGKILIGKIASFPVSKEHLQ